MLLTQLIKKGVEMVSDVYPEREAREIVYACLESIAGTRRHTHIVEPGHEVSESVVAQVLASYDRLAAGEPLQYVLGHAYFYGRQFRVTPDVLIPRPETELLCRNILDFVAADAGKGLKVMDLCTGSGCIAWTLALEMAGAEVTAVDISDGALAVASSQVFSQEMSRTGAVAPTFIKADVLCPPEQCEGYFPEKKYDIIVSNPPYVMDKEKALMRSNVIDHEPHLALFVSDDDPLIFYRAVAQWAAGLLKEDGIGVVEINEALGQETASVFKTAGFARIEVIKDLSDRDRFVSFRR